jgi:hypothetical protein
MKPSQKLKVEIEGIVNVVRFDELSPKLIPFVGRLEREGDIYGPVIGMVGVCAVYVSYADKRRGPVKPTIFGYDWDEFKLKQY